MKDGKPLMRDDFCTDYHCPGDCGMRGHGVQHLKRYSQETLKGGKREGAGRPPAPPRPMPISWRPDTQAQRDKWLELGGARWVKRLLDDAIAKHAQS